MNIEKLLKCQVERFEVSLCQHSMELWLPQGHCTDMKGAIKFAASFDPKCCIVITWSGGELDTVYMNTADRGWICQDGRHIRWAS